MEIQKWLWALLVSTRPRQWLKNLTLLAAPFLGGVLFNPEVAGKMGEAFLVFSLLSSCAYIINDLVDRRRDRKHPVKKNRPIASGALPPYLAAIFAIALGTGSLIYTYLNFNYYFFGVALAFIGLQLTYSFWVRNLIILDALWVGAAFVLRVYAGAFVIPTPISSWIILSAIGLSLLLAFGKRRSERTLLSSLHKRFFTRETLRHYPEALLDATIAMSASYTALAYSIFAFQNSPASTMPLFVEFLPTTLSSPKWLLLTVPIVIYGIARYLFVIYEKKEGESPEKVLLSDFPLLGSVVLWTFILTGIIYLL
ncbi:hypothetical protein A2797_00870 [candidate division WWE3 bacterium RIFCSPHIGHO2_01_FULL_48_15]|uniref:Phosphoribose diphosphate--decaprenyl-phosphate phosphoribosyltransferase n=1 Tax=candidate division WWE3 bacterium RIFCSPHIGHO2_01_FULL_48_15 TaxID=1802619 RepID=A0A1F4VF58_UNCKA|nr:MAG: hypothetical protein A2797_00870 [candidate division WWE3 bacterium RIFCSPHIGHO2_01_FULL_48_15]